MLIIYFNQVLPPIIRRNYFKTFRILIGYNLIPKMDQNVTYFLVKMDQNVTYF